MWLLLLLQLASFHATTRADNEPYTGVHWKNVAGCEEKRENNFFVLGCNQVFYRCHNARPYRLRCPKKLYFNPLKNECGFKKDIKVCQQESIYRGKLVRSLQPFVCTRSGNFEHPQNRCDNTYYTCVHGRAVRQRCREDQVFDELRNRCDYKQNVKSCRRMKHSRISGNFAVDQHSGYSEETVFAPAPPPPPVVPGFDYGEASFCLNRPDGDYSMADCSDAFVKCASQKMYKYACPSDHVFSRTSGKCHPKNEVASCSSQFDCTGKADGYHEKEKCQSRFFSCLGGKTKVLDCTPGLVYDSRIKACDYPLACRAARSYEESPIAAAEHGAILYFLNKYDCTRKEDGLHEVDQCSHLYIQCFRGATHTMKCPDGLIFNGKSKFCDYPEACLGSPPSDKYAAFHSNSPYDSTDPQQDHDSSVAERLQPQPPRDRSLVCRGKSDGYYSVGCSTVYMACISGEYNEFKCPGNLKYSSILKNCDHEMAVPECNKHDDVDTSELCQLKGDGAHQLGCQNKYVVCTHGISSILYCPAGLAYSGATSTCVYPLDLAECRLY